MAVALAEPYMHSELFEPEWKQYYTNIGSAARTIHEVDKNDAWIRRFATTMVDIGWTQEIISYTKNADEMGFGGLYALEELPVDQSEDIPTEDYIDDDFDDGYMYDYIEEEGIDLYEEWAYFQGEDEYPDWENMY